MNQETLKRLQSNPHYKMGKEKEKPPIKRKPMIEFGQLNRHNQTVPLHDIGMQRVARTQN